MLDESAEVEQVYYIRAMVNDKEIFLKGNVLLVR